MGDKVLNAWVVLGGRVDNSFTQLGNGLTMLGSSIDGISQKLINFGKESVNTYRSYEDSMLDAQVAMATTYGKGTKQLNEVMEQLDRQASEWAATSIFHTDDVAAAIAEAAHANWDLDRVLEGIPAAMKLAQAGGMDLSTGLDYIIKSTNAAKISFAELGDWVDEWTYAANSSAGTVEEFGEAMLKMGATMQFADNKEELLTMLAVLHDAGTTGSNAGTLLRNTMIRLVAPTKKATDAMEELGVAQSDIDEALSETDGDLDKALKMLDEAGFSAYNSKGELKDFTTIFEDLAKATAGMSEDDMYAVWSAIFPTRTITGAMSLIEAATKNWNGLLDALNGGEAAGYGDYAAETMMSGLTGSIELFNSKVEELKRKVGAQLAPQLENILGNLGRIVDLFASGGADNGLSSGLDWLSSLSDIIGGLADNVDGMDPAVFDALVAGLGSIAALGPTLLGAGFAIRTIGWGLSVFTGSVVGKIVLAAAALAIIQTAMDTYSESKWLQNFGNMEIDTTNLDASMNKIKDAFEIATGPTNDFANALSASVQNYETAASTFSQTMLEDLLSGETLEGKELEDKLEQYRNLGKDMVGALKEGITNSADMSAEFWARLFKGQNGTDEDLKKNEVFAGIIKALDEDKSTALAKATAIGDELQAAISAAWEDGNLDPEEREKIKEYFRQLNEAMAQAEMEAQNETDYIKRRQMMDQAQGMNYQQMAEYVQKTIAPQRQEELDWYEKHYGAEKYRMEYRKQEALKAGDTEKAAEYDRLINGWTDESGVYHAGANEAYEQARAGVYSQYDQLILDWYAATMGDSVFGQKGEGKERSPLDAVRQAAAWLTGGEETNVHTLLDYIRANSDANGYTEMQEYYQRELEALGGVDEVKKRIAEYNKSGDDSLKEMASGLEEILAIYSILNPDSRWYTGDQKQRSAADLEAMYKSGLFGREFDTYLKQLLDEDIIGDTVMEEHDKMSAAAKGYADEMAEAFGQLYDVDMINELFGGDRELPKNLRDDYAMAMLLGMDSAERAKYRKGGATNEFWHAERNLEQANQEQAAAQAAYDALYSKIVKDDGTIGGTAEQQAKLQGLKAELELKNQAQAEAQAAYDAVQQTFATPIQGIVELSMKMMGGLFGFFGFNFPNKAKGGRETEPSIFAEAGIPEWYIPEEHTANTGKLLLAAARGSGFSLLDLAQLGGAKMFAKGGTDGDGSLDWGSLPGGKSGGGFVIQYSPVINAQNADGVREELEKDKERLKEYLEKFMADRELYASLAAY